MELTDISLKASAQILYKRALELGIEVERFKSKQLLRLSHQGKVYYTCGSRTSLQSSVGKTIADKKHLAREVLNKAGLPIPEGDTAASFSQALEVAQRVGFPLVVVKPSAGRHGQGVSIGVDGEASLKEALIKAKKISPKVVLEREIKGNDYRVVVINYKFAAAAWRRAASVLGDGRNKVKELIDKENQNPDRGKGHVKPLTLIRIDEVLKAVLREQGFTLESIPPAGKEIKLSKTCNLSTGGKAKDVTDKVPEENIKIFERVAQVCDLNTVGIDLLTTDISQPLSKTGGKIIEINASPGLRMHHFPSEGKPQDVAGKILAMLFPELF